MREDLLTLEILRLRRLVDDLVSADPDYAEDIKEFYTNSIYADMSDSEREIVATDRMIEHQEIIKGILEATESQQSTKGSKRTTDLKAS